MDKIEVKHPARNASFSTGAYSDGVIVDGFLFISGQAAIDYKTSSFKSGTIEEETALTLQNIKAIISAAGASMEQVVKCTVHLSDIREFDQYDKI